MHRVISFMSENWLLVVAVLELVLTLLWFPPLWRYSIPVKTTQATFVAPLVLDVATLATASEAIGADLVFRQIGPGQIAFRTRFRPARHQATPIDRGLVTARERSAQVVVHAKLYWFVPATLVFLAAYGRGAVLVFALCAAGGILAWNLRSELRVHQELLTELARSHNGQPSSLGA